MSYTENTTHSNGKISSVYSNLAPDLNSLSSDQFVDGKPGKSAKYLDDISFNTSGRKDDDPNDYDDKELSGQPSNDNMVCQVTKESKCDNKFNIPHVIAIALRLLGYDDLILQIIKHASKINEKRERLRINGNENVDQDHYCFFALLNYIFNATIHTAGDKNMSINHLDFCASLYYILKAIKINEDVLKFDHRSTISHIKQKCQKLKDGVIKLGEYYNLNKPTVHDVLNYIWIPTRLQYKKDKFCFRTSKSSVRDKKKVDINQIAADVTELYLKWGDQVKEMMRELFYIGKNPLGDVTKNSLILPEEYVSTVIDGESDRTSDYTCQPDENKKRKRNLTRITIQKPEILTHRVLDKDPELSKLRVATTNIQFVVPVPNESNSNTIYTTKNPIIRTASQLLSSHDGLVLRIIKDVTPLEEDTSPKEVTTFTQHKKASISQLHYCVFALLNYIFNATVCATEMKYISVKHYVFVTSLFQILKVIRVNEELLAFDHTDKNAIHLKYLELLEILEKLEIYDSAKKSTVYEFLKLLEIPTTLQYKKERSCFRKVLCTNDDRKFDINKLAEEVAVLYKKWGAEIKQMIEKLFYYGKNPLENVIDPPFISMSTITDDEKSSHHDIQSRKSEESPQNKNKNGYNKCSDPNPDIDIYINYDDDGYDGYDGYKEF